jgi:hypothetical protein
MTHRETIDLSNVDMFTRLHWASENLEPYQTDYRVIFEDPAEPDAPVKELCPSPEWMACALAGGILPSVEHQHNMKLELQTQDGEKILTNYLEAQQIYLEKRIVGEKVVDYNDYLMPKPIGPMTEEEAIEYIIKKDVPARVWSSEYKYNRPMYKVVKRQQLSTQNQFYRDCWRLSESDNELIEIDVEKAKNVWKNKMRWARKDIFEKLDMDFFRVMEDGDSERQKEIAVKKKLLREVTDLPELKAAQTIEEIEAVWPEYLNG